MTLFYATNRSVTVVLVLDPSRRPTNNVSLSCKILFPSSQHRLSFVHSSINTTCVASLIKAPANLPSLVTPAICREAMISVNKGIWLLKNQHFYRLQLIPCLLVLFEK